MLGVAITALAVDYVFIDISQEPPEVLSARGSVTDADFSDDGVWLEVDEPEGIYVDIDNLGGKLEYSLFGQDGRVLKSGGGNYILFPEYPPVSSVLLQYGSGDADDNGLSESAEPAESGESRREVQQQNMPRSGGGFSFSDSGDAPYHQNSFDRSYSFTFEASESGFYNVSVASDDSASVTVGGISASSTLNNPGQAEGHLDAGIHMVAITWSNIGGPYFINVSVGLVSADSNDDERPILVVNPSVSKIVAKTGSENCSYTSIFATIENNPADDPYYIETEWPEGGGDDVVSAVKEKGSVPVRFNLMHDGMCCGSATGTYVLVPESEEEDGKECDCSEGTQASSGSVDFSQVFGRTPQIPSLPKGALKIHETMPVTKLNSPDALFYDHPIERTVLWQDSRTNAVIRSPSGSIVRYENGIPAGISRGCNRGLSRNSEGFLVERLDNGTMLTYDAFGKVSHLQTEDMAVPVAATNLGITVSRDNAGAITNVYSVADGNMAVETLANNSYRVVWTAPSGAQVKTFTFTRDSANEFSLYEYRDETFNFHYRWTYSTAAQDWVLAKAPGTSDELKEEKTIVYDPSNQVWQAQHGYRKGSGALIGVESSVIDVNQSPKKTNSTVGGRTLYDAQLGADGRVSQDVNDKGLSTSYVYDNFGRTLSLSRTIRGGMTETISNEYSQVASAGIVDLRPLRTIRLVDDIVVSDTEYSYGATNSATRTCGGVSRTSFKVLDYYGRTVLAVQENGRAEQIAYSPAIPDLSGWTETRDTGIWTASSGFALVNGKSERTVSVYNASGNETRTERYALVAGDWEEIDWVNRTYNATHKVISTEKSNGKTSSAAWICTGPIWQTGEDGITVSNAYDRTKTLVSSTRYGPFGAVTTSYIHDAMGRITSETDLATGLDPRSRLASYDDEGRIVSQTDEQGRTTTYVYSSDGRTTTMTLPSGGTRITTVNPDGSLASITGTAVTPEYYTYGIATNGLEWTLINYVSTNGLRWVKTYTNGFGDKVKEERPGANNSILVTDYTYNTKGQLTVIASTGEPTEARFYDSWGDVASVNHSAGTEFRVAQSLSENAIMDDEVWRMDVRAEYCSDFDIAPVLSTNLTQRSGLSLSNEYYNISIDKRGNRVETWSEFDPSTSTRTAYTAKSEALNTAERTETDGVNVQEVSYSAVTNSAACDAYRRIIAETDGRGNATTNVYNALGQLASATDAVGNTTYYAYDAAGRLSAITNALGVATVYQYDIKGNKTYEGGGTYPVAYAYDAFNVMTNMTTYRAEGLQAGDTTTWNYDEATGLLLSKTYADGNGPTYTYSDNGNLATRTWARGTVTTYSYDGWNSLTNTAYSDGTPSISIAYDAMGRQTNAVDAVGITTTTYDDYGEVAAETVGGLYSRSISHVRDAYGRDLGLSIGNSRMSIVEYEADTARMKRVKMAGAWFTYYYLPGTDLKSRLQYGGSGSAYYTYEPSRDLLTQVQNYINGGVISQYDYVNDALGRRTAITRSGSIMSETRTDHYGYNDRNELTNAVKNATLNEYAYQYDDIGNRLSSMDLDSDRTYVANELNQYTNIVEGVDGFLPEFDLDGNQTKIKTATGVWDVTYNGENRPVAWTCGTTNIVMKFDRMGRRVEYIETVSGVTNIHHRFVYDGYLCIQRLNALSNNAIDLVFGWDPSEQVATRPLILQKYGAYSLFYTHDGNKNVSELVFFQQANGIAAHYEYAPFGAVIATSKNTPVTAYDFREYNPFRFSSEYADDMLGTVYYNYRHYNPMAGRWLRRDPRSIFGNNEGSYLFVNNQIAIDVLGLEKNCCCKVCVYSATDLLHADKEALTIDEGMSGHTWFAIEPCDTDETKWQSSDEVFSFGPEVGDHTNKELLNGVPGGHWDETKYIDTSKYKVVKKCWSQDSKGCHDIREEIKNGYPKQFSLAQYCTTETVSRLKKHDIAIPDGYGPLDMQTELSFKIEAANPKALGEQLQEIGGIDLGIGLTMREKKKRRK